MPFRFVHAADLHLDSPLRSLALRDGDLAALIGTATRAALAGIVDLCLEERVDALLIAGDLYDGDQTSMKTALFLAQQLARLDAAGIPTFVIRGNHDAIARITRELTLPDSVFVFSGRAEAKPVAARAPFDVHIHGISFKDRHAPDSLLDKFRPPVPGAVNLAMLHTSLGGAPGHDLYAPCSPAELSAAGFDYWALGHIHQRSVIEDRCTIVMPGMPQGRDIGESGAKSVSLVTVADDRTVTVEERVTAIAQFERVAVDLAGIDDWRDAIAAIDGALGAARDAASSAHLVARPELVGSTPLAWRLRRDADLIAAEARRLAVGLGATWIDKVEIAATPPAAPAASSGDPVAELRALVNDEVLDAPAFGAALAELADELAGQLPGECRGLFGDDPQAREAALRQLAREGAETVLARLQPAGDKP